MAPQNNELITFDVISSLQYFGEDPKVLMRKIKKYNPVHPGEILEEDFLKELELSQYRLAKDIHVPSRRINEILRNSAR